MADKTTLNKWVHNGRPIPSYICPKCLKDSFEHNEFCGHCGARLDGVISYYDSAWDKAYKEIENAIKGGE